jgi:hypothetical protein
VISGSSLNSYKTFTLGEWLDNKKPRLNRGFFLRYYLVIRLDWAGVIKAVTGIDVSHFASYARGKVRA